MIPSSIPASTEIRRFVGVPWVSGGRDAATGLDCWGVVMAAERVLFGRELPDYRVENAADPQQAARAFDARHHLWARVGAGSEVAGDVIVLTLSGVAVHAGIVIEGGVMLHSLPGRECCIERYRTARWARRIEGFYRWTPR